MENTEIVSELKKVKDEVVTMELQMRVMDADEFKTRIRRIKTGIKTIIESLTSKEA